MPAAALLPMHCHVLDKRGQIVRCAPTHLLVWQQYQCASSAAMCSKNLIKSPGWATRIWNPQCKPLRSTHPQLFLSHAGGGGGGGGARGRGATGIGNPLLSLLVKTHPNPSTPPPPPPPPNTHTATYAVFLPLRQQAPRTLSPTAVTDSEIKVRGLLTMCLLQHWLPMH